MNDDEDDIRAVLIDYKLLPYQRFCPGAPHGPPFTAIAKGNAAVSVGLMVILAASSSIVASMLLHVLLPLMSGERTAKVNVVKIFGTLLLTQLLPLCAGLVCGKEEVMRGWD